MAVIGAGSSGIQIVPAIQPLVEKLDHYVRGKTWIATPMAAEVLEKHGGKADNTAFGPEEIQAWLQDPATYLEYRKDLENIVQSGYGIVIRNSDLQHQARAYFQTLMSHRLAKRPEILSMILPSFSPLCKRLTPGPGYLEALSESNVSVISDRIDRVTERGVMTVKGHEREVDVIVCATGFDTSFVNRFPIIGLQGVSLADKWRLNNATSNYLSLASHDFPNMFMMLGPNSGLGTGNLLMILERVADYITEAVVKLQAEGIQSMMPSKKAEDHFTQYCDEYFQRTVFSEECSSWYKSGSNGRITALWPGSALHALKVLSKPRWEDFDYAFVDENPVAWLGDGSTRADTNAELDKSYYLTSVSFLADAM